METDARQVVEALTLEQKASLCVGGDFWHTVGIERSGLHPVTLTDGPHGLRLERGDTAELGLRGSVPATCFPTASALGATWDRDLVRRVGAAIADEAQAHGVGVVLGPGANMKRSPLCGRNFEYLSEDPVLTGELAAALVDGLQSRGVGASLKHLAVNDQETRRMTVDEVVDERTLRELYLTGFEIAVRRARPWTVMCSYPRVNGTYASEHRWLLTEVLRDEWGHDGIVVSDWGAVDDRVAALAAGCDLEMPGTGSGSDRLLVDAVTTGRLDERLLDLAAERMVTLARRVAAGRRPGATFDLEAHHRLAREAAEAGTVLLANDGVLPLADGARVALVGPFATEPRFQGTGSSRITPTRLDDLRTELTALLGEDRVVHARGVTDDTEVDAAAVAEAVATANAADVAIVCVGLPDGYENEGDDRTHLGLPPTHDHLVRAVAEAHDRVVVVLSNGAPVELPWADDVAAIVEGYLGGQAGAGAVARILTGAVNPSGKLAETFPVALDDTPTSRTFPGGPATVEHREGPYVGYRFYDTVGRAVRFPFGHGLGYTTFAYGDVEVSPERAGPDDTVTVSVEVTNTGTVAGSEVVQVYVRDPVAAVYRPDKELKGFAKVHLEPGRSERVTVALDRRAFAFWDTVEGRWVVEAGEFELLVGASSRDLRGRATVTVEGEVLAPRDEPTVYRVFPRDAEVDAASFERLLGRPLPANEPPAGPVDRNTPIGATGHTLAARLLRRVVARRLRASFGEDDPATAALVRSMLEEAPLRTLLMGGITHTQLDAIVDVLNGRWVAAGRRLVGRRSASRAS